MMFLPFCLFLAQPVDIKPLRETMTEPYQTDDPAVWIDRAQLDKSMIFGTVKMAAPHGGISVYGLDGFRMMRIEGLDRPNNVDVAYNVRVGNRTIDIAVATERNKNRLRIFEVIPGIGLQELAALPVFEQPMGVAMYTRKRDNALYAVVSRKTGPSGSYLFQYRVLDDGNASLKLEKVREFGTFSGSKEIEAIAVDNDREHIYYSDEGAGIRKYHADPSHPDAAKEIALFGQTGWTGDREGIAIHGKYVVATDQQPANSVFHVFDRDSLRELGSFRVGSDTTDGIEISRLGHFIAMNDNRRNFIIADWKAIAKALKLR
jgi:3-phytase